MEKRFNVFVAVEAINPEIIFWPEVLHVCDSAEGMEAFIAGYLGIDKDLEHLEAGQSVCVYGDADREVFVAHYASLKEFAGTIKKNKAC